jgi:hypothetical protein
MAVDTAWVGVVGAAVGGIIGVSGSLLVETLRHRRFGKERRWEILTRERIESYKELWHRIHELWWNVPERASIDPLMPFCGQCISPESKALREITNKRVEELKEFVWANSLVLSGSVQRIFWDKYLEFYKIRNNSLLSTYPSQTVEERVKYDESLRSSFDAVRDDVYESIVNDLSLVGFKDFLSINEVKKIMHDTKKKPKESNAGKS